jgi:hypothetical protein
MVPPRRSPLLTHKRQGKVRTKQPQRKISRGPDKDKQKTDIMHEELSP